MSSVFNSDQKDAEYPIINIEAENEHFEISDSLISWLEAQKTSQKLNNPSDNVDLLHHFLPPASISRHPLSAPGMAWNLVRLFSDRSGFLTETLPSPFEILDTTTDIFQDIISTQIPFSQKSPSSLSPQSDSNKSSEERARSEAQPTYYHLINNQREQDRNSQSVRMRGNDEWAPPRAQIIFNIHEETNFRKLMQRQNYRCAGCGAKIDLELARRLVLYCHYLGKYFCKCCFSHKSIHLPCYILQKWDFHKYPVSHFALQLLDRISNEPLFNIQDINPSLYRKVKKLKQLVDIRLQLYYLKIYISTCAQTDVLAEIQHGKLYEYLNDLVARSIAHIAQCDRCRAKGHYCQLCGPSSLMSSMILNNVPNNISQSSTKDNQVKLKHSSSMGQNISTNAVTGSHGVLKTSESFMRQSIGGHSRTSSGNFITLTNGNSSISNAPVSVNIEDHELIFPFEIGRVAQCRGCGCCFHLQCFMDAGQNCPKCERIQRRRTEMLLAGAIGNVDSSSTTTIKAS